MVPEPLPIEEIPVLPTSVAIAQFEHPSKRPSASKLEQAKNTKKRFWQLWKS